MHYLAKALTEPIDLMALMSTSNASMQQSGSNWQHSDPMAYSHRQIDSSLIQWHTVIVRLTALWSNGIQSSSDWQHSDPKKKKLRFLRCLRFLRNSDVLLFFLKWSPEAVGHSHTSCPDRPRHNLLSLSLRSLHSFHTITGATAHSRGIINPLQLLTSDNLCPFISAGWRRGLESFLRS